MDNKVILNQSELLDYLMLSNFLNDVENVLLTGLELSSRQSRILIDLANQFRDTEMVINIEKRYNNKNL